MTDMPEAAPQRRWSSPARICLAAGLLLAVGATALLVVSEDTRWLRVGIVAALWAALFAGFVASGHRRRADVTAESSSQAQRIYELELEKEVSARREYELEIEKRVRTEVEAQSRSDVDSLRSELTALRETLEQLFGAEVTYERIALTAQSTRMRSADKKYSPSSAFAAIRGRADALSSGERFSDEPTQMIPQVLESEPQESGQSGHEQPQSHDGASDEAELEPSKPDERKADAKKPKKVKNIENAEKAEKPTQAATAETAETAATAENAEKAEKAEPKAAEQREQSAGTLDLAEQDDEPRSEPDNGDSAQNHTTDWTPSWERDRTESTSEAGDAGDAPSGRHSSEPEEDDRAPTGSHSSGRSVSELLAALGNGSSPRRHRRRG